MKVKLIRAGNTLLVQPWVSDLEPVLKFKKRERAKKWPFKYSHQTVSLFGVRKGVGLTYGGMYSRIRAKLKELGIPFEVENRKTPIPEAQFDKLSGSLRDGQDVVMAAISVSHCGRIDCPTAFGKSFIIVQLARIYPDQKILVVTPGKQVVESLFKRLTEQTDRKVIQVRAGFSFNEHAGVVVATCGSLHHIPPDWPDILLFDECHGAAAPETQGKLVNFGSCRMFGFSASPEGRGDGADMVGEAFFGPVLAHMPYAEGVKSGSIVPIEVFIRRVECPDITYRTDVQKERHGYWANFIRNTGIQSIANNIPDDMQTLIMVKTTEHAMALKSRLPEYQVVHGGRTRQQWVELSINGVLKNHYTDAEIQAYDDHDKGENLMLMDFLAGKIELESYTNYGNPDTTALREQFEAGTLKKVISTTMWKEGIDPVHLRVLIRADGMSGSIPGTQIPGRLARTTEGKKAGILIDFLDCFGDTYYRRSQTRIRHYRKQKWRIHEDWDGKFTSAMESV